MAGEYVEQEGVSMRYEWEICLPPHAAEHAAMLQ